ncbi:MAG: phosphoribosylamine--glycine ligase [Deltaproteobacteria bacterium]|nr:MAG: phosphoribosylamine--glycine ligase [Deltaproteobacteria bacterium]
MRRGAAVPSQTETGRTSEPRRTVLVVGGGGREHALAWRLARSPSVGRVLVCPGNGGTEGGPIHRVADVDPDAASLIALARRERVDLTVIGPEAPLAAGVVDAFTAAGLPCFGPTAAAAEIEASKAFSKAFMARHHIPTARGAVCATVDAALAHLAEVGAPLVVKASGLAAGKGVIVCETAPEAEAAIRQLGADGPLVLEEKLVGEELSVMAFCDGATLRPMPAAQDHKAAYDGDRGPNTGGMGAYTPVPAATPEVLAVVEREVLLPALRGLAAEGRPFKGVLYAGVMVTDAGVRVLEFNARFGDPETQVVLPLLEGDLADILLACVHGALADTPVRFAERACATVVAAAGGYPGAYEKGWEISGLDAAAELGLVFHAGTRRDAAGRLVTSGGRVLATTGLGDRLGDAVANAYAALDQVRFDGLHARRDIAHRALRARSRYADAGVDIDAANRAVREMKGAIEATHNRHVLNTVGAFGGLFDGAALAGYRHPVLVASTDGVGTKTMVAARLDRWDTLGVDLVNHCIDDILVQGARPLFFLDYVASARIDSDRVATVVKGVARACAAAGCALLGGETAEMPGVYQPGELDLAGTIVGVVERDALIDGRAIAPGDVVLALPSSGLHTNGYSLARHILADTDLAARPAELGGQSWGDALLAPHRSYLPDLERLWAAGVQPKGLAHITGGGLVENPPRILPAGTAITLDTGAWRVPPLFTLLQRLGAVPDAEMRRVFNLGLGMLVVVAPADVDRARAAHPELLTVGGVVAHPGRAPEVLF